LRYAAMVFALTFGGEDTVLTREVRVVLVSSCGVGNSKPAPLGPAKGATGRHT
jgi:hypothetical protein